MSFYLTRNHIKYQYHHRISSESICIILITWLNRSANFRPPQGPIDFAGSVRSGDRLVHYGVPREHRRRCGDFGSSAAGPATEHQQRPEPLPRGRGRSMSFLACGCGRFERICWLIVVEKNARYVEKRCFFCEFPICEFYKLSAGE